uniref:NB-ARC domain-containing protein n=1 Tax=Oryza meridionalis TaxID=40149 RepID=A0A0E0CCR3_9ORYZ
MSAGTLPDIAFVRSDSVRSAARLSTVPMGTAPLRFFPGSRSSVTRSPAAEHPTPRHVPPHGVGADGSHGRCRPPTASRSASSAARSPAMHVGRRRHRACDKHHHHHQQDGVAVHCESAIPSMSGIGAMIASSVANRVASRLSELVVEEASLLWRFKDDMDDMEENMRDLEAVIQDADGKARQGGEAERRWLNKLKSVAYDVEDVLDELDAAQLIKNHQPKLKLFLSRNNPLLRKMTIARNMKNLREKIVAIKNDSIKLHLVHHEPVTEGSRGNETFADDSDMDIGMLGRDAETKKIISLLLNTEAKEDISIIPIVGLGGLGKTTLAQAVFADERVNVFDMRIWVYVSKEFDLLKIGKAIIRGANRSINLDNCNLQFVKDNLKKELANRRYLIVLDDLWEEYGENLEKLKQMLQHGGKGSKIIATTRSGSVVQVLYTGYLANERKVCPVPEPDHISLGVLSTDDCWMVMKRRVFGPDDEEIGLEQIGRQIASRCGGLPLVANALGQIMSEHRSIEAWTDIRDRKIALDFKADHQQDTLERLMLSYYYMKREFKMCFTYLAAFSKGFVMHTDRLIQQWRALGYIEASDDGQRCIHYLLGMSFLQISKSSLLSLQISPMHTKSPRKLTMHDLVHDLATIIAADEFLDMDATVPSTWNKTNNKRYCRHAQLVNYQKQSRIFKDLPSKVRTFHFRQCNGMQLPPKAFTQAKYIRILDMSGFSFEGHSTPSSIVMPSSIRKLMLLAYLDVSGLPIIALPKYFHTLQNMQTLILSNCSLETLPANMGNLHKLCCLDLSRNNDLTELPTSFENLLNLSLLNLSGCSKLEELPESVHNLKCLQQLDMSGCCALQKLPSKFGILSRLSFVNLSSCSKLTKLPDNLNLDSLEHLNLSNCHKLENLPEDFGNLYRLKVLDMSDCYKIHVLPKTFCQLKHLKDLNLSDCHGLKQLPECIGDLSELHSLNLTSCSKLLSLPQSLCNMFKLKHLNLSYCIRIEGLPSSFGDLQLQVLDLTGCYGLPDLPDSISGMTSLTMLDVDAGPDDVFIKAETIQECLNLPGIAEHDVHKLENGECSSVVELGRLCCRALRVQHLENVECLEDAMKAKLRDMTELRKLILSWGLDGTQNVDNNKLVLENLLPPRTLEKFVLNGYTSKVFPNWMSGISSYLPYLTYVRLSNLATSCLPAFGQLPNLRFFSIVSAPNIRKIGKEIYGEGGIFKKLRAFWLEQMYNLEEFWTTQNGKDDEFLIPDLHILMVIECPRLSFLPYPPRSMYWRLDNCNEVLPERGFGSLASSILPFRMTISNCNFSPDRWRRLQHLATLEMFQVDGCSGLHTLPDVIQCFISLKELYLRSWEDLEILPEWLGQLISLEDITIINCPKLKSLPKSIQNLTALRELRLEGCEELEISPELFGHLTSLKVISIQGCPYLTDLPESMKNLTFLEEIWLGGFNSLPEWIGQFICLKEINIYDSPNMTSLPESIRNLTSLKELYILNCPRLVERCQGEDASNISHIPRIILDDEIFIPGQAVEGSKVVLYTSIPVISGYAAILRIVKDP